MRTTAWMLAALILAACGNGNGGDERDGGGDTAADRIEGDAAADQESDGVPGDGEGDRDIPDAADSDGTAPSCGNGAVDQGEACDGDSLGGFSCASFAGYAGGVLRCNAGCTGFDLGECAPGGTITAASCEQSDVQAAVDAAAEGDTVLVPGGTCTYTTSLVIEKQILLRGAGTEAAEPTVIEPRVSDAAVIVPQDTDNVRITGFIFDGGAIPEDYQAIRFGRWNQDAGCANFRVDHNLFRDFREPGVEGLGFMTVRTFGFNRGVIDHNEFRDDRGEILYTAADGFEAYDRDLSLGKYGNGTIFVEDNLFVMTGVEPLGGSGPMDGNEGARTVFRYNTLQDTPDSWFMEPFDSHGFCVCDGQCTTGMNNDVRGILSYEIYGNAFATNASPDKWNRALNLRGGKGVIFDNDFTGEWETIVRFTNERSYDYSPPDGCHKVTEIDPPFPRYERQCHVDTDDGGELINEGLVGGELVFGQCLDQIHDVYLWSNTFNGREVAASDAWVDDQGYQPQDIVEGLSYFFAPMPGYVPYPYPHPLTVVP